METYLKIEEESEEEEMAGGSSALVGGGSSKMAVLVRCEREREEFELGLSLKFWFCNALFIVDEGAHGVEMEVRS